jgi:hypothetical protein
LGDGTHDMAIVPKFETILVRSRADAEAGPQ